LAAAPLYAGKAIAITLPGCNTIRPNWVGGKRWCLMKKPLDVSGAHRIVVYTYATMCRYLKIARGIAPTDFCVCILVRGRCPERAEWLLDK